MLLARLYFQTVAPSEPPGAKETAIHLQEALKVEFLQQLARLGRLEWVLMTTLPPLPCFPPTRAPNKDNSSPTPSQGPWIFAPGCWGKVQSFNFTLKPQASYHLGLLSCD